MADYPTSLPSITRPSAGQKLNSPAAYIIVDEIADEIEAIAQVLGLPDSSTAGSIWEYLTSVHTHDGTDSQPVSGVGGVSDHDSLTGVSTDDHHTEAHPVGGAQHTGTMSLALQGEEFSDLTADYSHPTSNTTFANSGLDFDMETSKKYMGRAVLWINASDASDFKIQLTGPASPTRVRYALISTTQGATGGGAANYQNAEAIATAFGTTQNGGGMNSEDRLAIVEFFIANGTNAGTVNLQFAQRVSGGTASIIRAGSYIYAKKVD